MIIDAHVHLGGAVFAGDAAGGVAALLAAMDGAGIDKAFVMSLSPEDNAAVLAVGRDHHARLVPFMMPDIGPRTAVQVAEAAAQGSVWGLGEFYIRPGAAGLPTVYLQPVLEAACTHRLPVLLHTGEFSYTAPILLVDMVRAYPDVTFILGHMGSSVFVLDAIELAKRHANVLLETSGMPSPAMLRRAVAECGPERVLFGSDYPFWHPGVERARIETAGLDPAVTRMVLGENAARLLEA